MTTQQEESGRDQVTQAQGILRQMLAARHQAARDRGRPPQLPRTAPATPVRAAATAFGRVAERLYGLAVQPLSVKADAMTLAELTELLPERPLLALLQGPGDSLGAMALCPEMVAALVEIQALGRVTSRPLERRRPTRSEAMLCADFINALMAELQADMAGLDGFETFARFRFATSLEDPRPLGLLLEDRAFRSLSFRLAMGSPDSREGSMLLALPQPSRLREMPVADPPARPGLAVIGSGRGAAAAAALPAPVAQQDEPVAPPVPLPAQTLPEVEVELVGVLCRRHVSLGDLRALGAGKLLQLPRVRLSEARIETAQGQVVAQGKFGEAEGCHAIRLRDPDSQSDEDAGSGAFGPGTRADPDPAYPGMEEYAESGMPLADLSEPDIFRMNEGLDLPFDSLMPVPLDRAIG